MQRNNQSTETNKSSTSKIHTSLRMGGPPAKKPIFGPPVQIYDGSEEIKIDEDGRGYIGISIKELIEKEKNEGKYILSKPLQNENGIYNLNQENRIDITEQKISSPSTQCDQLPKSDSLEDNLKKLNKLVPQRYSSYFYSKGRDLYGFTQYENNELQLSAGCQLYWIRPGSFKEKYNQLPSHPYEDNAYIFVESKNQLLYGKKDHFEEVKINDLVKFKEIFKTIMDDEYQYDHKHITDEEINTLITFNCGRIPNKENSINHDSKEKILSMKI